MISKKELEKLNRKPPNMTDDPTFFSSMEDYKYETYLHFSPNQPCPVCGSTMIQKSLLEKVGEGKVLFDAVVCPSCKIAGMKCAAYKGKNSCRCQTDEDFR